MTNLGGAVFGEFVFAEGAGTGLTGTLEDTFTFSETWYQNLKKESFSDTLTFTDVMSNTTRFFNISDTFSLSDAFTSNYAIVNLADTLAFSESFSMDRNYLSDTLVFTDALRQVYTRSISDTLIFTDQMVKPIFDSISDTLSFSDSIVRVARLLQIVPDTLSFTEGFTFNASLNQPLTDSVLFTEALTYNATLNKVIGDTLAFYDGYVIKSKARTTPTVIDTSGPVTSAVIRIFPRVVLKGPTRVVVLPAPNFNDFVANTDRTIIKRSMSGSYRTYIKTSQRKRYNWSFTVPRNIGEELKYFIYVDGSKEIDIEDWEGRLYKAKLVTDSIDFTESRRWEPGYNAMEVTLEFEGVQYA